MSDYNPLLRSRHRRLTELRTGLGEPLPPNAQAKIERLLARLELVLAHLAELERERDAVVEAEASDKASKMISSLPAPCAFEGRFGFLNVAHLPFTSLVRLFRPDAQRVSTSATPLI